MLAAIYYADDVVLAAASGAAAEVMVAEVIAKLKEVADSWCRENTLDKPPEDDGRKHCAGRVGCAVGRGVGICGIQGVFGCKREARDCTEIS